MTSSLKKFFFWLRKDFLSLSVNVFANLTCIFHLKKPSLARSSLMRWCYKHFLFNFSLCFLRKKQERNISERCKLLNFQFSPNMFSLFSKIFCCFLIPSALLAFSPWRRLRWNNNDGGREGEVYFEKINTSKTWNIHHIFYRRFSFALKSQRKNVCYSCLLYLLSAKGEELKKTVAFQGLINMRNFRVNLKTVKGKKKSILKATFSGILVNL